MRSKSLWATLVLSVCLGVLLAWPRAAWAVPALHQELLDEGVNPRCHSHVAELLTFDDLVALGADATDDDRLTAADTDVETSIPLVMICIGFEGQPYDNQVDWHDIIFQDQWSLAQFYRDMSFDKFTFVPACETSAYDVDGNTNEADRADDGVIHVSLAREKLCGWAVQDFDEAADTEMFADLTEALGLAGQYLDFAAYDQNGDGAIQNSELALGFVVSGFDASSAYNLSDEAQFIWPHAWSFSEIAQDYDIRDEEGAYVVPVVDGVQLDEYIGMAEYVEEGGGEYTLAGVGTLAHELGHYLGLPDLYATNYGSGPWMSYDSQYASLMSSGSFGTDPEGNERPYSLDMWSRVTLGWVEPTTIDDDMAGGDIAGSLTSSDVPIAYRIDTDNEGEYYLLENRRFVSWDETMGSHYRHAAAGEGGEDAGGGILAWHIDDGIIDQYLESNEVNDSFHHPGVVVLLQERMDDGSYATYGGSAVWSRIFFDGERWGRELILPSYGPGKKSKPVDRTLSSNQVLSLDTPSQPVMSLHQHALNPVVEWEDDASAATMRGWCYDCYAVVDLETTHDIATEVVLRPTTTEMGLRAYTAYFKMDNRNDTVYELLPVLDGEVVTERDAALKGLADLIVSANAALAQGLYTSESFAALREAIEAANALFEDDATVAEDVLAAQRELLQRWRELEPVDRAAQEAAAAEAAAAEAARQAEAQRQEAVCDLAEYLCGAIERNAAEPYRPAAYAAFVDVVDAAYGVLADKDATLEDLAAAKSAVARAEAELRRNGKRVPLAGATLGGLSDVNETGRAHKPVPEVRLGNVELAEGTDYSVSYRDNVKVGTARVVVTGMGDYVGTAEGSFRIRPTRWVRLAGATAVATMQAIVKADGVFAAGKVGTVVVAGRRDFRGALAAVGLAGLYGAPLVTTDGASGALSAPAKAELQRLKPSRVVVVGDTGAVPAAHYRAIVAALPKAKVTRVSAKSASATAVAIATVGKTAPTKWGKTCVVATQASFKDAMSIAPYAYAKHAPVFFTESKALKDGKGLSAETVSAIKKGGFTKVLIVGGKLAVPESVESQLRGIRGVSCQRLAGADAIGTSAAIARFELANGLGRKYVAVATTADYADALAGAALTGARGGVLVLANKTGGLDALDAVYRPSDLTRGYILGGTSAISADNEVAIKSR